MCDFHLGPDGSISVQCLSSFADQKEIGSCLTCDTSRFFKEGIQQNDIPVPKIKSHQ